MNQAMRSVRAQPAAIFYSSLQSSLGNKSSVISFRPIFTSSGNTGKMEQKENNPDKKTGDAMSDSFGGGYASRSDEEGFGGTGGGSQSKFKIKTDKDIHEDHPAYDMTQGSEVKEKEESRNQTKPPI